MLRERPLGQECELKMQRQQFSKSRMIQGKLKTLDWWSKCPKCLFRRWWLLSDMVRVILQVPMMDRMGKMWMMKTQSRGSWAKMSNPTGWWAQSQQWCSSAWSSFARRRWSLRNRHIWDGTPPQTMYMIESKCTAHWKWWFQQSYNSNRMMRQRHLHWLHVVNWWNVVSLSLEYRKCHKGLLDQEVVIVGYVLGSNSQTLVYMALSPPRSLIHYLIQNDNYLNSYSVTHAYSLPS